MDWRGSGAEFPDLEVGGEIGVPDRLAGLEVADGGVPRVDTAGPARTRVAQVYLFAPRAGRYGAGSGQLGDDGGFDHLQRFDARGGEGDQCT